jgi:MFS family permease
MVSRAFGADMRADDGFFSRARIVAQPGFNRWLVPPAAVAIHLCIGMAYGFSVFWLPLTRAIPGPPDPSCTGMGLGQALVTTVCNWRISDLGWMFTLFFVSLGSAAALFGGWLERAGPRRAGLCAAACWAGGLCIAALGVYVHQLWIMWLGAGVIGGIGLGLGYISPVSTLIKWFPDRRGMATGMAIMGFGGGALVGAPLATLLMARFHDADGPGVWQTLVSLGVIYAVFMTGGALGYRVPPDDWAPPGFVPAEGQRSVRGRSVALQDAFRTRQFWLVWAVLMLNVSAGIGVLGIASPMLQEIFAGQLIGAPGVPFTALDPGQRAAIAVVAAGFVGMLSLFNIGGRFFWASLSDWIGRRATYATFFLLGIALYAFAPTGAHIGSRILFVASFCIILSMYGGGFATVPAYLADLFGTRFVGAIHGRLLTAWSAAGIVGPVLVNYIRQAEIGLGVPRAQVYDVTLYVLTGLLVLGFICNLLIHPLAPHWFTADTATDTNAPATAPPRPARSAGIGRGGLTPAAGLAWAVVVIPILWGTWRTLGTAVSLFR